MTKIHVRVWSARAHMKSKFFTCARGHNWFTSQKNFGTRAPMCTHIFEISSPEPPLAKKKWFFVFSKVDKIGARAPKFSKIKIWDILYLNYSFFKNFGVRACTTFIICPQSWTISEKWTVKSLKNQAHACTRAWKFLQKSKILTILISAHALPAKNMKKP